MTGRNQVYISVFIPAI